MHSVIDPQFHMQLCYRPFITFAHVPDASRHSYIIILDIVLLSHWTCKCMYVHCALMCPLPCAGAGDGGAAEEGEPHHPGGPGTHQGPQRQQPAKVPLRRRHPLQGEHKGMLYCVYMHVDSCGEVCDYFCPILCLLVSRILHVQV